jgi:hypothetical protein
MRTLQPFSSEAISISSLPYSSNPRPNTLAASLISIMQLKRVFNSGSAQAPLFAFNEGITTHISLDHSDTKSPKGHFITQTLPTSNSTLSKFIL